VGNAIWSPNGRQIALWLQDETDDAVYLLDFEGNGPLDASSLQDSGALRRLETSVSGEWPRYWSEDGDWIITIAGDEKLYALDVAGKRRVPLAELGPIEIFDQRHYPWRTTQEPVCTKADRSWWRCR
jgi:Tol biopolymer transport system component